MILRLNRVNRFTWIQINHYFVALYNHTSHTTSATGELCDCCGFGFPGRCTMLYCGVFKPLEFCKLLPRLNLKKCGLYRKIGWNRTKVWLMSVLVWGIVALTMGYREEVSCVSIWWEEVTCVNIFFIVLQDKFFCRYIFYWEELPWCNNLPFPSLTLRQDFSHSCLDQGWKNAVAHSRHGAKNLECAEGDLQLRISA